MRKKVSTKERTSGAQNHETTTLSGSTPEFNGIDKESLPRKSTGKRPSRKSPNAGAAKKQKPNQKITHNDDGDCDENSNMDTGREESEVITDKDQQDSCERSEEPGDGKDDHKFTRDKSARKKTKTSRNSNTFRKTPFRERVRELGNTIAATATGVDGSSTDRDIDILGISEREDGKCSGRIMFSEAAYNDIENRVVGITHEISNMATVLALLNGRKGANVGDIQLAQLFSSKPTSFRTVSDMYDLVISQARLPPSDADGNISRQNLKQSQMQILSEYMRYKNQRKKTRALAIKVNASVPIDQRERLSFTLSGYSPLAQKYGILPESDPYIIGQLLNRSQKKSHKRADVLAEATSSDGEDHLDQFDAETLGYPPSDEDQEDGNRDVDQSSSDQNSEDQSQDLTDDDGIQEDLADIVSGNEEDEEEEEGQEEQEEQDDEDQ